MIEKLEIIEFDIIKNNNGSIIPLHKRNQLMKGFGEVYFSTIHPNVVKAWHLHKKMTVLYSVIYGEILCVFCNKNESKKKQLFVKKINTNSKKRIIIKVPPNIWVGFKCVGLKTAIIANITNIPYAQDKPVRLETVSSNINYNWSNEKKY